MKNAIAIITMLMIAGCSNVQVTGNNAQETSTQDNTAVVTILHPDQALDTKTVSAGENEILVAYADDTGAIQLAAASGANNAKKDKESAELDALFADEGNDVDIPDPLEGLNRGMFWFNDKLYFYFLKPIAKGYRAVIPEGGRTSVANFFSNVTTPIRFFNSLFQLKFQDAGNEAGRFAINTTIGIIGLFDPAKNHFGIKKKDEDFGQTLGFYGAGPGFYIVLPVLGPSSFRDGIGLVADYALDPISYIEKDKTQVAVRFVDTVNELSLDKDTYEGIKRDNLDPYLTIRDAYIQRRVGKIKK